MYALAVEDKEGTIEFAGAFKYRTIDAAIKAIPKAEESREQTQRLHPDVYMGPIVGVVDRQMKLVWKREPIRES